MLSALQAHCRLPAPPLVPLSRQSSSQDPGAAEFQAPHTAQRVTGSRCPTPSAAAVQMSLPLHTLPFPHL